jgi:hypothetical protein
MMPSKNILSVFFVALLFAVPLSTFIDKKGGVLADEQRMKTGFPNFPRKADQITMLKYFNKIDSFFSDHFPARNAFLDAASRPFELLRHNFDFRKCFRGNDGWLFIGNNYDNTVSKLQLSMLPDKREIASTVQAYAELAEACNERGIQLILIIGPNKSSIYEEYLPPVIHPAKTRYVDFFVNELQKIPGLIVHDPTRGLRTAKHEGRLFYYRTDTHWNDLGAFTAFEGARKLLSMPPLPALSFAPAPLFPGGLLGIGKLQHFPLYPGDNFRVVWDVSPSWREEFAEGQRTSVLPASVVVNPGAASGKVAWVTGDSFTVALKQYINAEFRETRYVGHRNEKLPTLPDELRKAASKPDVVLVVAGERIF